MTGTDSAGTPVAGTGTPIAGTGTPIVGTGTPIAGTGTPESVWLPYLDALALPPLDLAGVDAGQPGTAAPVRLPAPPPPSPPAAETPAPGPSTSRPAPLRRAATGGPWPGRVLLVAPHPDDEVLAAGGLLALLSAAGVPVEVVAVTDGEASNPGGSVPPAELAAVRRTETDAALAHLGVGRVTRLGLPDGGAGTLEDPVAALELDPGDLLLGPWTGDGHPDHEAVGRGCVRAAARTGARLVEYPVWAWHWGTPGDPRIPWSRARRVDLPAAGRSAKARAIGEFRSQVAPLGPLPADAPVLSAAVLARFARPYEVLFA